PFDLLSELEFRIAHTITHLGPVLERHLCDGLGILRPLLLILLQCRTPITVRLIEALQKLGAVLKAAVHSLTEERNNRVRGIAHERHLMTVNPPRATDGAQFTLRMAE